MKKNETLDTNDDLSLNEKIAIFLKKHKMMEGWYSKEMIKKMVNLTPEQLKELEK